MWYKNSISYLLTSENFLCMCWKRKNKCFYKKKKKTLKWTGKIEKKNVFAVMRFLHFSCITIPYCNSHGHIHKSFERASNIPTNIEYNQFSRFLFLSRARVVLGFNQCDYFVKIHVDYDQQHAQRL